MTLTLTEAKTKWCPMFNNTSINNRGSSSNNRKAFNEQTFTNDCTCIADECALWKTTITKGGGLSEDCGRCGLINK